MSGLSQFRTRLARPAREDVVAAPLARLGVPPGQRHDLPPRVRALLEQRLRRSVIAVALLECDCSFCFISLNPLGL